VAIIYDYETVWALRIQPGFEGNNYHSAMMRYYSALVRAGVNVDMIKPSEDLSQYRLVIAPDFYLVPDEVAKRLSDYVKNGGVLLADCRLAVKDKTNLCYDRTLPGLLSEALGVTIEEYEAMEAEMEYPVVCKQGLEGQYTGIQYADWLEPNTAETLAAYGQWHLSSFAAATRNSFGKGTGYYVGTVVKEAEFYDELVAEVLRAAKAEGALTPPVGVEVSVREGGGKKLLFLVNHTEEKQTVAVPSGKKELITGGTTGDTMELDTYGVAVIKLE
jgi:beta-galactosidase